MLKNEQKAPYNTFLLAALVAGFTLLTLFMVTSLSRDNDKYLIQQAVYHYSDDLSQQNIDNIDLLPASVWSEENSQNFGFTLAPQWLKFELPSNAGGRILEIDYPMLDDVQLWFRKNANGTYVVLQDYQLGDNFDFNQRPIIHDRFLIPVPLEQSSIQVLLRIKSKGAVKAPLKLWATQDYIVYTASHRLFLGLFFGYMLAMGLINVFLFTTTKNTMFITYAGYVFSFALLIATLHGIGFRFIWPHSPWFQERTTIIFAFLMMSFVLIFSSQILDLKKLNRNFYKALQVFFAIYLASTFASFVLSYALMVKFFLILSLFSIPTILFISLSLTFKGSKIARYFSAAWLVLMISGLTATADNFHWVDMPIDSSYLLMVGASTETLLLALALATSYSLQRNEARLSYQEADENEVRTIQVQDELLQLQKQAQLDLEEQVRARTQEFEKALSGLSLVNTELKDLSETDALTGLTNRRLFNKNIKAEAARSRRERNPLAIALLDIDNFKAVNDNYGHQCGDDCLVAFADALKRTVKRPGDLLSRFGGEEFVVMLPNTTIEGATVLLEKVRLAIEAMIVETQGNKISFTVSAGLTARVVCNDGDTDIMLAFADKLLYKAKEAGRNCIKSGNFDE